MVSPLVLIALPFAASFVTGCFQHKDFPHATLVNAAIAALFFLATSLLCWALRGLISFDAKSGFVVILSFIFNTTACKSLNEAVVEAIPSPLLLLRKRSSS